MKQKNITLIALEHCFFFFDENDLPSYLSGMTWITPSY